MNRYHIRFNKTRGQPGRGTVEHVWRVFENGQTEYLVKHFNVNVPVFDEATGDDWNMCCIGFLTLDKETSTAVIDSKEKA